MNQLVKILSDDGGVKVNSPVWHLVSHLADAPRTLCAGEAFGPGESGCEYEEKAVKKGGVTCHDCIEAIKYYKSVKL